VTWRATSTGNDVIYHFADAADGSHVAAGFQHRRYNINIMERRSCARTSFLQVHLAYSEQKTVVASLGELNPLHFTKETG